MHTLCMKLLLTFALAYSLSLPATSFRQPNGDQELIDCVNSAQTAWKAGKNVRAEKFPPRFAPAMPGMRNRRKMLPANPRLPDIKLPDSFDARKQWPECPSISEIRDQGECGASWAFATPEAISDRICIHSKGTQKVSISSQDLLSCCNHCGYGCKGGNPAEAWQYWVTDGIVTGSNYSQRAGCQPYAIPPCGHYEASPFKPCNESGYAPTPTCQRACQTSYREHTYDQDKHFGSQVYQVFTDANDIMKEIYLNGPVTATFTIYTDFFFYTKGIYMNMYGIPTGVHTARLLGWGVEDDIQYWLAANSWNSHWGDNGYFKIVRGSNECGIESGVYAGLPKLK